MALCKETKNFVINWKLRSTKMNFVKSETFKMDFCQVVTKLPLRLKFESKSCKQIASYDLWYIGRCTGEKIHITSVQTFWLCRCCFHSVNKNRDKNNNKNYRKITRQKQINIPLVYSLSVSLPFAFTLFLRLRSLSVSQYPILCIFAKIVQSDTPGKILDLFFVVTSHTLFLSLSISLSPFWLFVKMKNKN